MKSIAVFQSCLGEYLIPKHLQDHKFRKDGGFDRRRVKENNEFKAWVAEQDKKTREGWTD